MGGGGGFGDGVVVYRRWLTKSTPDTTSRSGREPGHIVESAGALAHTLPLRLRVRAMRLELPFVPPHQGWVVPTAAKHSIQRAVSALCCRVGCALVPSDCCDVVLEGNGVKLGICRPIV